ncbi:acyl-ACP desaturase [Streptomyces sp. NBC_01092]|uniref:acyl-ACP desaturase n=1 Tax=Streptomyces sp. NBC_01092 TaxID=2903748 RepID=UPI00386CCA02|nr:acyl-ACP desaturase [Streptomyces sp. NBC_01092]
MSTDARTTPPRGWLHDLEPIVETQLHAHLMRAQEWFPHQYVPWSRGRDFDGPLEGAAWDDTQSALPPAVRASLIVTLLTEDNLPSYHHEIATLFGRDGAWGTWVHRWTAEEDRHGAAIRSYLHTTRAVDPIQLERTRMSLISTGFTADQPHGLHSIAYVALQELATRISHRNTGRMSGDPVCDRLLARIATDENLHMVIYRGLLGASFDAWPDQTMRALTDTVTTFRMPGHLIPGFNRMSLAIAYADIYNLRIHRDDVLKSLLRSVDALHRTDVGPEGERAREELAAFLAVLDDQKAKQQEKIEMRRAQLSSTEPEHRSRRASA